MSVLDAHQRAQVLVLWNSGRTYGELVALFGCTRNTIAGLIGRARQKGDAAPISAEEHSRNKRKAGQAAAKKRWGHRPLAPPRKGHPKVLTGSLRKHAIPDIPDRHRCHWPLGDPGEADFRWCGARAAPAGPYCREHCREAYRAPGPNMAYDRNDQRPWRRFCGK